MDKSSANYPQKQSTGRRTRSARPTTTSDFMTPPPTQSMISPSSSTSQLTETSVSSRFLKIIGDTVEKFIPGNKMSEVFAQLAAKFKEEEDRAATVPSETPVEEPEAHPPNSLITSQSEIQLCDVPGTTEQLKERLNVDGGVERTWESEEKKSGGELREVVDVDELESGDEKSKVSERARRRDFRVQQRLNREELRDMREEAVVLAAVKREATERRRKEKSVATSVESKKSNPTSLGVVIREAENHSAPPTQEEGQYVGTFEWVNVDVDQRMLDDMIRFDDPKLQ